MEKDGTKVVNLNASFSNTNYHVNWISSAGAIVNGSGTRAADNKTVSSFRAYNGQDTSMNVCWFAIGY